MAWTQAQVVNSNFTMVVQDPLININLNHALSVQRTRIHSSRMCTAHSLTVSRHILCNPPSNHACPPQPCMPPCNHACPPSNHTCPLATMHPPHNHACPPQPCMPPTTTDATPLQPLMPPSNHSFPLATTHAPPATMHTPRGQNSWHTLLKILPCPKLRLRAVNIIKTWCKIMIMLAGNWWVKTRRKERISDPIQSDWHRVRRRHEGYVHRAQVSQVNRG